MNLAQAVGRVLLCHRELIGMTRREAARRSGVSFEIVGSLERGYYERSRNRAIGSPRLDTVAHLAEALGLKLSNVLAAAEHVREQAIRSRSCESTRF